MTEIRIKYDDGKTRITVDENFLTVDSILTLEEVLQVIRLITNTVSRS